MDFKQALHQKVDYIQTYIENNFEKYNNLQKIVYDAMEYSLFAGGKRLRPVLMLSVCEMLDGNKDDVLPFSVAIEMIHNYSLIHDDLPCMDNDDLRRGKPTNHKVFGEDISVLAGDALLNKAFEFVLNANIKAPAENILKSLKFLSTMSGTEGMIGGQVVDIACTNKDIKVDLDVLYYMYSLKTGALIRASAVIGAIMSGASQQQIDNIDEYAKLLGIAFQVQDDILDVEGDEKVLGKPIGSDKENDKNTFVDILGIEKSKRLVEEDSLKAIKILKDFGDSSEFLIELTKYLINRSA